MTETPAAETPSPTPDNDSADNVSSTDHTGGDQTGGDGPTLVRPREGRMIAGVCAGIAQRWNLDITLVRVAAVTLALFSGIGLAAYLAAWLLVPSVDGVAMVRPGMRGSRLFSRLPAIVLIVLAVIVLAGISHALWFGAPVGLLVVALIVAAVVGTRRGRWLLVALAAVLALGIGTVGVFGSHFGTKSVHVTDAADLNWRYDYGVGTLHLDLSGLQLTGSRHTEVRMGRGDVILTVPSGMPVVVHARSGLGTVDINGHSVHGLDAEQTQTLGTPTTGGRLVIDVAVGIGQVQVHQG
jgi:phage shock protein PspC (stress-responsive transcriptional regulator)/predicted membrane protein